MSCDIQESIAIACFRLRWNRSPASRHAPKHCYSAFRAITVAFAVATPLVLLMRKVAAPGKLGNCYAVECFMDELAVAAKSGPANLASAKNTFTPWAAKPLTDMSRARRARTDRTC